MNTPKTKLFGIDKYLAYRLKGLLRHLGRKKWLADNNRSDEWSCTQKEWDEIYWTQNDFVKNNFKLEFLHKLGYEGLVGGHPYLGMVSLKKLNQLFVLARMSEIEIPDSKVPQFISK